MSPPFPIHACPHTSAHAGIVGAPTTRCDTPVDGTLKAVSPTVQTWVGCHPLYRQEIMDGATWE
jgi:hypothetical protein